MRLLIVNSNATQSVTEALHAAAAPLVPPGCDLRCVTAVNGPPAIETPDDAQVATDATLQAIAGSAGWADAAIIACFSDPGLAEARRRFPFPVTGIADAAMAAAAGSGRFSIVTVAPSTIGQIEALAEAYGHTASLVSVRALPIGVLDSHRDRARLLAGLAGLIDAAVIEDRPNAVILGGAVTAGLLPDLAPGVSVPLIDGLACAIKASLT